MGKYKYKVVLVCPVASWFRGNNLEFVVSKLAELDAGVNHPAWLKLKGPEDKEYCHKLYRMMRDTVGYELRIEHPFINFYTDTPAHVEKLAAIDEYRVKYVSMPNKANPALEAGKVLVKKLDFDYKVHMGRTRQDYKNFVAWAENNDKLRLPKRIKTDLSKSRSWGGGFFYVKGEQTLTLVKVFVGSDINKIESVIKA